MSDILRSLSKKLENIELVIFDLDGTLSESKKEIDGETGELIGKLLKKKKVAVIGGGKYEQFQSQLLFKLRLPESVSGNLFLFPTSGSSFYRHGKNGWEQVYAENLSRTEKEKILNAFENVFKELGYRHSSETYGELIEDRGTQITFSALGQKAPVKKKEEWNKNYNGERFKMADILRRLLPDFEVRTGGLTSIDVTRKGIDKEYGVKQIKKYLGVDFNKMLFIGDALYPGGNDFAVLHAGVPSREVGGPNETKRLIRELLKL